MSSMKKLKSQKLHTEKAKASANSGRIWRVLRNIAFVVLLIVFILQIGVTIYLQNDPQKLVNGMPLKLFEITSDSMYPQIKTGDGVLERKVDFAKLKAGDVITFYQSGEIVTHEIISVNDDGTVTTEGIQNGIPDNAITEAEYIGKVIVKLPALSNFLSMSYGAGRKTIWIAIFVILLFGPDVLGVAYDRMRGTMQKG